MPTFSYTAIQKDGKYQSGRIEAINFLAAGHLLKEQGLLAVDLDEKDKKIDWGALVGGMFSVGLKEKIAFIQNLDLLLRSGVSAPRAMRIISKQTNNRKFRTVIENMAQSVESGKAMYQAMKEYPKVFSQIFVSMIEVGELSGNLEKSLEYLRLQLQREADLKAKIKGAMIYPAVIVSAMIVIGILMAIFVLPKLVATFKEFDTQLPFMTRVVIKVSDFMADNSLWVITGLVVAIVAVILGIKTPTGRKILDFLFLRVPVIGPIVKKINIARFSRILGSLMKSGISVVQGLQVTGDALGNFFYRTALLSTSSNVKLGKTITESLTSYPELFPFIVTQMLAIGEETGSIEQILDQLADHTEVEIDDTMKNLSSIIEPMLLLVIGVVVGFLALALIMPIYSISQSIS